MSRPIVCIDAGHYGNYNRCPAIPEYSEARVMWKLHMKQKYYLEKFGVDVTMTRLKQEVDLSLKERGMMAENCNVIISDHSNAVGGGMNEDIDYIAIYCLTEDASTTCDDISKDLAMKLAPVIHNVMDVHQGFKVLTRKSSNDRNGDGQFNDNYYGLLNGARLVNVPGLIIEHSFHTNSRTVKWLLNDANLDLLARAEAECIASYLLGRKVEVEEPAEDTGEVKNDLYRVQVGAYSIKERAIARWRELKDAGFDAIIVKVDNLYKVQVGAFGIRRNAENRLDEVMAKDFHAFITTRGGTFISIETKKSVDEVAKEVLDGKWGNGVERRKALEKEGYDYDEIQNKVNELLKKR